MNEEITTAEELIEDVEAQAINEFDECIETLSVSYSEYLEDKKDKELRELYQDAINDLKTLLGDYADEDHIGLIQEAYDILFEEIDIAVKSA